MPVFTESQTLESHNIGHFGYSAVPLSELEATQYTLATIVCDRSTSTSCFTKQMTDALKSAVVALQKHPMNAQMLVRVIGFDNDMEEIHGFIPVGSIDADRYEGTLDPRGMTALYDSCISAAEATVAHSETLRKAKYLNNGIIIVITDGLNNAGRYSRLEDVDHVKVAFESAINAEQLESLSTLLIAVNTGNPDFRHFLQDFHDKAGFTSDMIDVKNATDDAIARVGRFVTSSISSTSMALGTGGPSQSLQF